MKIISIFIKIAILTLKFYFIFGQNLSEKEEYSVTKFREYLRIPTVNPNPNYEPAINFLKDLCNEIGLNFNIVRFPDSNFAIYCTWNCSEPNLKSIMMNSHVDVVPAAVEKWTYPPFEAFKDKNGNIYGRGAHDSKSKGIQYLFAIKKLIDSQYKPRRCVHVTFVSDEELPVGGGMEPFTQSKEFKNLNIGTVIEEGFPTGGDKYTMFYADKISWKIKMTAFGVSGHGSSLPENIAVGKIIRAATKMMQIRDSEIRIMKRRKLDSGNVNSVNLNMFDCGIQINVIPSKCSAFYDCRLTPIRTNNLADFESKIDKISQEEDVEIFYPEKSYEVLVTKLDNNNKWWTAFKSAFDDMNETLNTAIFPARSDAVHTRKLGLPVFEFAALKNRASLAHADDEFINERDFINGIEIYKNILIKMTSILQAQND